MKLKLFHGVLVIIFFILLSTSGCDSPFWPQLRQQEEVEELKEDDEQLVPFEDIQRGETPQDVPEGMRIITLYFASAHGNYLVPVQMAISQTEGIARATLEKLIAGPSPGWEMRYGLQAVLPSATRVRGLTIRDGRALVDLSQEVLDYEPDKERLMVDALVYTLTQFTTIERVSLMVEGEVLQELPGGTPAGEEWSRERGINLEVKDEVEDFAGATKLMLYFCLSAGEKIFYVPVTRVVPEVAESELGKVTVQELLAGSRRGSGLFSDLPPELGVYEVTRNNSTLEVNFSSAFTAYRGGITGAENMLNQISLTLTELAGVDEVQIFVGSQEIILPDGISLHEPISRPAYYNFLE